MKISVIERQILQDSTYIRIKEWNNTYQRLVEREVGIYESMVKKFQFSKTNTVYCKKLYV